MTKPRITNPAHLDLAVTIIQLVSRECNITVEVLESRTRDFHIVWPRWIIMHLLAKYTTITQEVIGELFGVNHRTVAHGIKVGLPNEVATNHRSNRQLFEIESKLLDILRKPKAA